ncbi:MAG TPA: hypothetical protein VHO07_06930 [Streptosporangiaceae bacterium]|nr:hypothetical protein [Streptosporangiaceae bacterium]
MGMPPPGEDWPARQDATAARRRRRRRRQRVMLWLLTGVTTGVLVVIYLFVKDIGRMPTGAAPAALSSSVRTPRPSSGRQLVSPSRKVSPVTAAARPRVTDASSGLSYQLLPSPWRRGCPAILNTPMFSWSAGENAVAGQVVIGGSTFDWHGNACSGQLQQQFQYSGAADLEPTAMSLVGALDPAYYAGLQHDRTIEGSSSLQVSGHQAWMVKFLMTYPDAAGEGLHWTTELGAVVVVDRGAGDPPAVFYVSVPSNLGTANVTGLIDSLRLSSP